jgi:hypothetical protein
MPVARDDPRLATSDTLPTPPGTSPFCVKGHVYLKMQEDIASSVGIDRVFEHVKNSAAVRAYFAQRFLAGSWYDAFPLMPVAMGHARASGAPLYSFLRDKGRVIAQKDAPGIYRALLRLASPSLVVERLPKLASRYFDFGTSDVERVGERSYRSIQRGVPELLVPLIAATTEGFVAQSLVLAGGANATARYVSSETDGAKQGYATMAVVLAIGW